MNFLIMLFVVLLSMLMTLLSSRSVSRHLICSNNQSWLLNLSLTLKHYWLGQEVGCCFQFWEKVNLFRLTNVITLVLFKWKLMGLFLKKNHLLRRWGCLFLLNWIGAYIISIAKTNSKKIGANWLGQETGAY